MTKPTDIERRGLLDRLICAECAASGTFTQGHYYCRHTGVFISVSTPAHHRKVTMLLDVAPNDLGIALIDTFGEDAFRNIVVMNAHFDA